MDLICLIRLHAELSLRAKGLMLIREAGFETRPDREIRDKLAEVKSLEKSIGKTGLLVLAPILSRRQVEAWQVRLLEDR